MKMISCFLLFLFSFNLYAQDSVYLDQDKSAPFAGYLLPKEKVQEFQQMSLDLNNKNLMIESYQKSIDLYKSNEDLYNKKVSTLMDQNDKLATDLNSNRGLTDVERIVWFGLGIVSVGLAVYAGKQFVK